MSDFSESSALLIDKLAESGSDWANAGPDPSSIAAPLSTAILVCIANRVLRPDRISPSRELELRIAGGAGVTSFCGGIEISDGASRLKNGAEFLAEPAKDR